MPHPSAPAPGVFARVRRLLFGERVRRLHGSSHGAGLRTFGRAWATPMTVVFSLGALISLGEKPLIQIVGNIQHHQTPNFVQVAILGIALVLVVGMDLTLLNSAVQLSDATFRGVKPRHDPYTRGAGMRVVVISLVESLTFAAVASQLDQPPPFTVDLWGALVAWTFIGMRALAAPVCAMYLATLGPRPFLTTELYDVLKLTVGAALVAKVEAWQFSGEHSFGAMWTVMILIDRVARATSDAERERLSAELMATLEGMTPPGELPPAITDDALSDEGEEEEDDAVVPPPAQVPALARGGSRREAHGRR
jgi:hypothetical protein